jgi:hypothetical protein
MAKKPQEKYNTLGRMPAIRIFYGSRLLGENIKSAEARIIYAKRRYISLCR